MPKQTVVDVVESLALEDDFGTTRLYGALRGVLVAVSESGEPLVDYCGNPTGSAIKASSTVSVSQADAGRQAILLFEEGDPQRPILMGLLQTATTKEGRKGRVVDVNLDGRQLTLSAEQEIVLRCGEASITLTRAGKVLIRGAYVLSRSTGVNRIKGGSVQMN